jgi:hypothetical protein
MEFSENDGLLVSFDEESNTFTFEWDEETHPEYSFLRLLTPEELMNRLSTQLQKLIDDENRSNIQDWGSSSGEAEIDDNPEFEE